MCGVVCGEFLDESIRASEASRTKTNGVAKRGQRAALGPPSGAAKSKAPQGTRSEGSRGDLSGEMSFGFYVEDDSWNRTRTERLVKRARLVEVSIVQDAAYPQTSSSLRGVRAAALDAARARLDLFRARTAHV